MGLIELLVTLILVGILLWAINSYIPMDPAINKLINIVVIVVVVLWLLRIFGVFSGLRDIRVGLTYSPPPVTTLGGSHG